MQLSRIFLQPCHLISYLVNNFFFNIQRTIPDENFLIRVIQGSTLPKNYYLSSLSAVNHVSARKKSTKRYVDDSTVLLDASGSEFRQNLQNATADFWA